MKRALISLIVAVIFVQTLSGMTSKPAQAQTCTGEILWGKQVLFRVRGPAGGMTVCEREWEIYRRLNEVLTEIQSGQPFTVAYISKNWIVSPAEEANLEMALQWDDAWRGSPTNQQKVSGLIANGRLIFTAALPEEEVPYHVSAHELKAQKSSPESFAADVAAKRGIYRLELFFTGLVDMQLPDFTPLTN